MPLCLSRHRPQGLSRGDVFVVTDGGLHLHLAASANFEQVIRKNYRVATGNRMPSPHVETRVIDPSCTLIDLLVKRMTLPLSEERDFVAVFQ